MPQYDTVSEALNALHARGYRYDFNLIRQEHPEYLRNNRLSAADFQIDEAYRFEGATDPGDENIVLAISSLKYALKGTLINGLGAYAEPQSAELVAQLKYKDASGERGG